MEKTTPWPPRSDSSNSALAAARCSGSAILAARSSTVPSVISRHAGLESKRFHSSKVNWKLFSAVSAWANTRVPRALHSSSHLMVSLYCGIATPCWSVATPRTL